METISNTLFWISNGLLVPVIVLLLLFFLRSLFFDRWLLRGVLPTHEAAKKFNVMLDTINGENCEEMLRHLPKASSFPLTKCLNELSGHRSQPAFCERLLANYEVEAERELGKSRILAKLADVGIDGDTYSHGICFGRFGQRRHFFHGL